MKQQNPLKGLDQAFLKLSAIMIKTPKEEIDVITQRLKLLKAMIQER